MNDSILNKIKKAIHNPRKLAVYLLFQIAPILPDRFFIKILFRLRMGYKLNLDSPQTYSEKLQWLKLYNRKPEYTQMVDKFAAKEYVAKIIGQEYIIPTLGVWEKFDDIDFDKLPNQFVLKTTHGGGNTGVVICKDKSTLDRDAAKKKLDRSLKSDIYKSLKEWPYKNVAKRIIAEQFIESSERQDLADYKFFCFNGEPKFCQVIAGRESGTTTIDWYDKDWIHQDFHEPKNYPFSKEGHTKPSCFEEMLHLASKLSVGQPFLRVDFYEIDNQIKFGELTFFPTSGMGGFDPMEWDYKFGEWIKLPK